MEPPTALVWSDHFQRHDTGAHPENARRLVAIYSHLRSEGLLVGRNIIEPDPAAVEDVALVHDQRYIDTVGQIAAAGGGYLDPDTYVSSESFDVALLAVGAVITAVNSVLDGTHARVFACPRPPGHHAEPDRGMGFCIFNNVAIAVQHALLRRGLDRVAIVDWDVHHGNGTQTTFLESNQVLFVSLHQSPLYPGTGAASERGVGSGRSYTLNIPLPPGSRDDVYLRAFDEMVAPRIAEFHPELIVVSAGFDVHQEDPLASMYLSEAGFAGMATRVRDWADAECEGRLVLALEGGYNLRVLASSVAATLRALDKHPTIEELLP